LLTRSQLIATHRMLLAEAKQFELSGIPLRRPNSMNNHGVVWNEMGFESAFDKLLSDYITPIARVLFDDCGGTHNR